MPTKIITDQPETKRRTLQLVLSETVQTLIEAPYFSIPGTGQSGVVLDPADADRELRSGEIFFATGIQIANVSAASLTVLAELVGEGGAVVTTISPNLVVPPNEVLTLSPGLSLFKRNLASPAAAGMLVRLSASDVGLQLTTTVLEREAIDHEPDTET